MEREIACDGRASEPVIIAARAPWKRFKWRSGISFLTT
jgi:hypothetical protein